MVGEEPVEMVSTNIVAATGFQKATHTHRDIGGQDFRKANPSSPMPYFGSCLC